MADYKSPSIPKKTDKKQCIVYLPYPLQNHGGARMNRGRQMIQAFQDIGYQVFLIDGYAAARKKRIQILKQSIRDGADYAFLYSESHFFPFLLTEPHHVPLHPFMDFGFFRYIRRQGIRIGFFLRDIEWKFSECSSHWKKRTFWLLAAFYTYDLWQYTRTLDVLYVPDLKMMNYLSSAKLKRIARPLPPGAENRPTRILDSDHRDFTQNPLHILYVGKICPSFRYRFEKLVEAVSKTENCMLTLCCPEENWKTEKHTLEPYLNHRIQIIHKQGDALEPYYASADLGSLLFADSEYMHMAIPYKSFEYLGHELPMIATEGMAIGEFIVRNNTGWVIPYQEDAIQALLHSILRTPEVLQEKRQGCHQAKQTNLWTCRAQTVAKDLRKQPRTSAKR